MSRRDSWRISSNAATPIARRRAKSGDWTPLADFYAADATYGWNIGPKEDVMCVGIDEIRDIALGLEMAGLEGWTYLYQRVLIDEARRGRRLLEAGRPGRGSSERRRHEIYGIGGSWFQPDADGKIEWQRDFFDFGHVQKLYLELMSAGSCRKACAPHRAKPRRRENCRATTPSTAPVPIW